ncbi:hypothetical protein H7992_13475 [Sporosarcina sp. resist]|uniref:hypothetical protein n=1 Tax=Sporosarcina sp. resist TaxID=2762563 RepID=UPI00164E9598|nr:hypothetical protein [Sporosarcina sp. resist]QNK86278.1 hypothetical protein H7992_13475 [Sporosarcina sp. resist]
MGRKMPFAYYEKEKREISVDEAREKLITKSLSCITESCRVPIIYIGPSERNYSNRVSRVKDYFKLKTNKKPHADNCKYNTKGQLKIFARDSEGVLTSLENGEFNFRLNLITSSLKSEKTKCFTDEDASIQGLANPSTKKYESKGKIDPYLSTMHKILKLRSEIESNSELIDLVNLSFGGQNISWGNFYYPEEHYKKCYNYVVKKKAVHPICLEGIIDGIKEPSDKFPFYSVSLTKPRVDNIDKDGIKRIPSVSITLYNESTIKYIQSEMAKGKENIAFYSELKVKSNHYGLEVEYLNIIGSINHKQQVHIF